MMVLGCQADEQELGCPTARKPEAHEASVPPALARRDGELREGPRREPPAGEATAPSAPPTGVAGERGKPRGRKPRADEASVPPPPAPPPEEAGLPARAEAEPNSASTRVGCRSGGRQSTGQ
ncbi:unnamed protein product [Prorocentrum cordatum]|uniref:Uncharacterized protein n=1 Tax=Prorocentrum cordatum TaxID=2364126 RepID=A0ABN9U590_9DINO|nr:unnamed protein product [Polarella glacialis]